MELAVSVSFSDLLLVAVTEEVAERERNVKVALPVGDSVEVTVAVPLAVTVRGLQVGEFVPDAVEETVG